MKDRIMKDRILITRPLEDGKRFAGEVEALGYEAVLSPLLKVVPRAVRFSLEGVGGLVFSSAAGLRAFAKRARGREGLARLPVFVMGLESERVARSVGAREILVANESHLESLLSAIRSYKNHVGLEGALLHAGGSHRAWDLRGAARKRGAGGSASDPL